jgi:biotin carboxyl carrier protein
LWIADSASHTPLCKSAIRNPQSEIGVGGAVRYFVTIGAQTLEVDVEGSRVRVGGDTLEAHLAAVPGTPLYHLLLAGESWTVAAQPLERAGAWMLGVVGERAAVEVVDERTRQLATLAARPPAAGEAGPVVAPMPGLVVRVEVAAGQRVDAGAGLVVIEAMKMENELRAPRAGVVRTVHVTAGEAVDKGAPLVTLASPEPSG